MLGPEMFVGARDRTTFPFAVEDIASQAFGLRFVQRHSLVVLGKSGPELVLTLLSTIVTIAQRVTNNTPLFRLGPFWAKGPGGTGAAIHYDAATGVWIRVRMFTRIRDRYS